MSKENYLEKGLKAGKERTHVTGPPNPTLQHKLKQENGKHVHYNSWSEKHYGTPYTKNRFSHKILFSRLIFYMQRIVEN